MSRQLPLSLDPPAGRGRCAGCAGLARTISLHDIPSLLSLMGRRIGIETFLTDVEKLGWEEKCLYAPLSGVRICKGARIDT